MLAINIAMNSAFRFCTGKASWGLLLHKRVILDGDWIIRRNTRQKPFANPIRHCWYLYLSSHSKSSREFVAKMVVG